MCEVISDISWWHKTLSGRWVFRCKMYKKMWRLNVESESETELHTHSRRPAEEKSRRQDVGWPVLVVQRQQRRRCNEGWMETAFFCNQLGANQIYRCYVTWWKHALNHSLDVSETPRWTLSFCGPAERRRGHVCDGSIRCSWRSVRASLCFAGLCDLLRSLVRRVVHRAFWEDEACSRGSLPTYSGTSAPLQQLL